MNPRHLEFVNVYLADPEMNATRAYLKVYPKSSEAAARRSAHDVLTRPDVHAYVTQRIKERAKRVEAEKGITQDFVLNGLKEVAQRCMQRVPVMTWSREDKCHVQATNAEGQGVWEFDSSGANRALELLGKHLGIFEGGEEDEKPVPVAVTVNVVDGRKA